MQEQFAQQLNDLFERRSNPCVAQSAQTAPAPRGRRRFTYCPMPRRCGALQINTDRLRHILFLVDFKVTLAVRDHSIFTDYHSDAFDTGPIRIHHFADNRSFPALYAELPGIFPADG